MLNYRYWSGNIIISWSQGSNFLQCLFAPGSRLIWFCGTCEAWLREKIYQNSTNQFLYAKHLHAKSDSQNFINVHSWRGKFRSKTQNNWDWIFFILGKLCLWGCWISLCCCVGWFKLDFGWNSLNKSWKQKFRKISFGLKLYKFFDKFNLQLKHKLNARTSLYWRPRSQNGGVQKLFGKKNIGWLGGLLWRRSYIGINVNYYIAITELSRNIWGV